MFVLCHLLYLYDVIISHLQTIHLRSHLDVIFSLMAGQNNSDIVKDRCIPLEEWILNLMKGKLLQVHSLQSTMTNKLMESYQCKPEMWGLCCGCWCHQNVHRVRSSTPHTTGEQAINWGRVTAGRSLAPHLDSTIPGRMRNDFAFSYLLLPKSFRFCMAFLIWEKIIWNMHKNASE